MCLQHSVEEGQAEHTSLGGEGQHCEVDCGSYRHFVLVSGHTKLHQPRSVRPPVPLQMHMFGKGRHLWSSGGVAFLCNHLAELH